MERPVISVVIPTRDRPDTLEVALRALSRFQQSPDIEFVVQDNSLGAVTADVVADAMAKDKRIRYSRSPFPASQRQNFEFGLEAARGDYLAIIGDDDGYCAGALDWLAQELKARPVDAVRWTLINYFWPSMSTDDIGFVNLFPTQCYGENRVMEVGKLADQAFHAKTAGSWANILVYHGMISRRIYDYMRGFTGGVFFAYPMPDVYAHTLLPQFCDTILQVNDLVSIYGLSGHSAGVSWTRAPSKKDPKSKEGTRWMAESVADTVAASQPWHPEIRTLRYHDLSALKTAERHGMLQGRKVDLDIWTGAIIDEIRGSPWQLEPWLTAKELAPYDGQVFAAVRKAFADLDISKIAKPVTKFTADPNIPSLRVSKVEPALADDVEGACAVLAKVTNDMQPRYTPVSRLPDKGYLVREQVRSVTRKALLSVAGSVAGSAVLSASLTRMADKLSVTGEKRAQQLQTKISAFRP